MKRSAKINGDFLEYSCGCSFPIVQHEPELRIKFDPHVENINLACPLTWDLFAQGNTKGVFQLETRFGQQYSKQLKPENIEHLAGLMSILRPGCIESVRDGKNVAEHYILRKNGEEEVDYVHPSLKDILDETYGEMIYQEQSMRIAQEIAGFNLEEADILRKSIGKKKADLMAKVKGMFLEGCEKKGIVSKEVAEQIFGWIEKSQRYSFNKCLSPDTIVDTPNGPKQLRDIEIGDYVRAPSDDYSKDEYVEVIDKIDQGTQPIVEVELESGHKIKCTVNHKFLCDDGVVRPLFIILSNNYNIYINTNES